MISKRKIFAISGSTRSHSSNQSVLSKIAEFVSDDFDVEIFTGLSELPHFSPDLDNEDDLPSIVASFRTKIANAEGVIICTPEYVFSLPGSLKNALEWCVSTTIFSHKPVGLITAAASGDKAHEQLKLIMKTIEARFDEEHTLLIKGVKGKVSNGIVTDQGTIAQLELFSKSFALLLDKVEPQPY